MAYLIRTFYLFRAKLPSTWDAVGSPPPFSCPPSAGLERFRGCSDAGVVGIIIPIPPSPTVSTDADYFIWRRFAMSRQTDIPRNVSIGVKRMA